MVHIFDISVISRALHWILLIDNCTLGQSYTNNSLLQFHKTFSDRKLQRPSVESKLKLACCVSILSYVKGNLRKFAHFIKSETENLLGSDCFLCLSDFYNSSFYHVFTSRFGDTFADQLKSILSFLEDVHNIMFYLNFAYLSLVYRLFQVRVVTSSPKHSVWVSIVMNIFKILSENYSDSSARNRPSVVISNSLLHQDLGDHLHPPTNPKYPWVRQ